MSALLHPPGRGAGQRQSAQRLLALSLVALLAGCAHGSLLKDVTLDDSVAGKIARAKADLSGIEWVSAALGGLTLPLGTADGGSGANLSLVRGDLVRANAGAVLERLPKGSQGGVLIMPDANDPGLTAAGASGSVLHRDVASATPAMRAAFPTQTFRNLYLRTDVDNSQLTADKVNLIYADEIVMNDGTRVPDWSLLTADITASGAGGLDTRSRVASTWYEIYAIRKSSDGTKNIMFHRMKDYFKDQAQETDDTTLSLRQATGTATDKVAQGFRVATAGKVEFIAIKALLQGTLAARTKIWAEIQTDSAGAPSGTVLATSDKLPASVFDTTARVVRFNFRSPATLSTSTQYWLVLNGDWTRSDANNIGIRYKTGTNPYANGEKKNFNGSVWSAGGTRHDLFFQIRVTRNDTALTMPSGYDQSCKIGQVFNLSTNKLHDFRQRGKIVQYGHDVVPYGFGIIALTNVADQNATVDLYAETGHGGVPYNAVRVGIGVEPTYSTNPAALALYTAAIRPATGNTDWLHVLVLASNTLNIGGVTGYVDLLFPEVASQQFRYVITSTDPATANKGLIIGTHGYEWE